MYYRPEYHFKPEELIDYLRKSQSDDPLLTVEEVLAKHEAILDRWDEMNLGGKVPEDNRFREVVSGETLKERPEITKVLRLIESPKIKGVKVVDPQRLTRGDLEDIGRLMKLFKLTNTYVIAVDEFGGQRIYDLRDEYDWNALEAELKKGNDYLKYTKKILHRGKLLSVSQGNYIGSVPPYGYDKTWLQEGKKKCPSLVENPEEADVVRMIFDMYVNKNMTKQAICYKLDDMKIKPPKGERWSPYAMKDMLANVHYIGKVKWNWRKTITIVDEGEIIETRPKSKIGEFLIYDGKHDGIVDEKIFEAAQKKAGNNPRVKAFAKVRNPLAGLLWCKNCGRAIAFRTYMKDGVERSAPRMICMGQAHCKTTSCLYADMIDKVSDVLRSCIEDFEVRIQNNEGDSVKLHSRLIKNLEKRKTELEEKELAQWEAQAHPDPSKRMPDHIFQKLNEKLLQEKEEVRQALCKAYESMPEPVDYEEKKKTFQEALDALNNPDIPAQVTNSLLKQCIERIEYHRETPERLIRTNPRKRITINGKRKVVSDFQSGANWSDTPIELDVKLKV